MSGYLVRALIALVFAALLWAQARAAGGKPHRRRAYELAAGALLVFAASNGALAAGVEAGPLQIAIAFVGVALMIGAGVELARSMYAGEMREQRDRIAEAAKEYRERRTTNDDR
jgi:hypothetical protein